MAYTAQRNARHRRRAGHGPLWGPLVLFAVVIGLAAVYVGYVLWPRWPEAPVAVDAPSLPIVVAGVTFNVEPAALRNAVQRRPGTQARIDLAYLWPSLTPPETAHNPTETATVDTGERMFVTIEGTDGTLSPTERLRDIYPRYLMDEPVAGPDGLALHGFRDETPYQGEQLAFDTAAPDRFLARCTLKGIADTGICLLERRIGEADITVRFPRALLEDWRGVASGIDRLLARLHPGDGNDSRR